MYQYYIGIFDRKSNFIAGLFYIMGSIRSIFHAKLIGSTICHYHLFHVNMLVVFDLFLTKLLGMKVIYTIHDVVSNLEKNQTNKSIINFVLKSANKILTHNQFSKNQIHELFKHVDKDIAIIPHGNYVPFIKIEESKEQSRISLNIPKQRKVLLFFGMIKRIKGLEIMLKALSKIKDQHPDILLVIAGKAWEDDFRVYQEIIDNYNLSNYCVIRNHYIPSEDVNHYFSAADLVVLPYKRISQSGVLMMAVSYKKAVLVSNLQPFKEVVTDNETGFVFQSENSDALAEKVTAIFNDVALLNKVSSGGFNLINTDYNWNTIGSSLKMEYNSLF
jgi:glycosyltransferase involved in cell wall biosynthesis